MTTTRHVSLRLCEWCGGHRPHPLDGGPPLDQPMLCPTCSWQRYWRPRDRWHARTCRADVHNAAHHAMRDAYTVAYEARHAAMNAWAVAWWTGAPPEELAELWKLAGPHFADDIWTWRVYGRVLKVRDAVYELGTGPCTCGAAT